MFKGKEKGLQIRNQHIELDLLPKFQPIRMIPQKIFPKGISYSFVSAKIPFIQKSLLKITNQSFSIHKYLIKLTKFKIEKLNLFIKNILRYSIKRKFSTLFFDLTTEN